MIAALNPIADLCQGYGVPLLLHANEPVGRSYPGKSPMQLGDLYDLIKAFPELTLILAHCGVGTFFFNLLKKEVPATLKNTISILRPRLSLPSRIYRLAAEMRHRRKFSLAAITPS